MSADLAARLEAVAALKHDLGKYSSWISANLPDPAWTGTVTDALVDALQSDLLRTRTRPDGAPEAVWEVWERLGAPLAPFVEPELAAVAIAVGVLRSAEAPLRAGDRGALGPLRAPIRGAQQEIRASLLQLHRRLLRAGG